VTTVLRGHARAHLEPRGVALWTVKWILPEDAGSSEYRNALGGATLPMFDFLAAHALSDEAGPLALIEMRESARPRSGQADHLGHVAVVTEEVLWPRGGDMAAGLLEMPCGQ